MDTRGEILRAANQAYAEGGYEKFSMRDVAGRVGLTPMALYRHFENKEHLLHHVQLTGFDMWRLELARAAAIADPKARLVDIARRYYRFSREHRAHFRLMFLEVQDEADLKFVTPEGARAIESLFEEYAQHVDEFFGQCLDPAGEAVSLWAHNHGLVSLLLAGRLNFLKGDFEEFLAARVDEYLTARRERIG